jgi:hypothetical protein
MTGLLARKDFGEFDDLVPVGIDRVNNPMSKLFTSSHECTVPSVAKLCPAHPINCGSSCARSVCLPGRRIYPSVLYDGTRSAIVDETAE